MANRPQFTSSWTCANGHVTEVAATLLEDGSYVRGSAWDFCDRCSEGPASVDLRRMWGEISNQAELSGAAHAVRRAGLVAQVCALIETVEDVQTVDVLASVLAEARANLVARDEDLRLRAEHLRVNLKVLAEAGLTRDTPGADAGEAFAAVSDRALEVYDLLDTCDRRLERAAARQDGEAVPSGVQSLLEEAGGGLESLAGDGVSCEYGIYVNGSRRSLGSVRQRFEELTHTVEALLTGPDH